MPPPPATALIGERNRSRQPGHQTLEPPLRLSSLPSSCLHPHFGKYNIPSVSQGSELFIQAGLFLGCQCSSAVEQRFRKPSVAGSIPAIGSIPWIGLLTAQV